MSVNQSDKEQIFNSAADLADAAQRAAYLDQACGDDAQLRVEIEELLRHDVDAGSFLEHPAVDFAPTIAVGDFDTVDDSPSEVSLAFLEPSDKAGCIGTLEHYEVIELVGRGGMGLVLKAFDRKLNRVVAIKVMAPELAANAMAVKRFLREARAAAAVSHDHVVTIHAIHDSHRPPFIVMEFVDGQSLQEKIDQTGGLELEGVLRIGLQTARGLAAAHEQGLVHRDIKPANILLENGVERVKLTDFGLARAVDDVSVTQTGQIAGTPQFMSPEQAQGHVIDARSDLFSLGSVLYTMCTGRPPFRAETAVAMLRRVTDDEPRSICEINSDTPDWLESIIFKLLAKDPAERFQSAEEVAELLSRHLAHLQHPTTAPQPPRVEQKDRQQSRFDLNDELSLIETTQRIYAVIALFWAIVAITFATIVFSFPSNYTASLFKLNAPWALATGVLSAITSSIAFAGTWHVRRRGSLRWAVRGNAAALLPVNPWLLFVVPWSIASIVKLLHPEVRRAFTHGKGVKKPPVRTASEHSKSRPVVETSLAVAVCFALVLGIVIFVQTDRGTLVIESEDENVEFTITRSEGETHEDLQVRIVDRVTGSKVIRMRSGHYQVLLVGEDSEFQLTKDKFVLSRGAKVIVRITRKKTMLANGSSPTELSEVLRFQGHEGYVLNVDFSPNGQQIVSGCGTPERRVVLWDARNGRRLNEFKGHTASIHDVKFSPDGRNIASAGKDRVVILLDAKTLKEVHRFEGHTGEVSCLAFSPDSRRIASASNNWNVKEGDVAVRVWDIGTGQEVWHQDLPRIDGEGAGESRGKGEVHAVAFSPDGKQLLTSHRGMNIENTTIWNADTGEQVRRFGGGTSVRDAAWSPDGQYIATAHIAISIDKNRWYDPDNCVIRLYDAATGRELRKLTGHTAGIASLDFSPDSKLLVSGSGGEYLNDKVYERGAHDNSIRVWDVTSGQQLLKKDVAMAVKCVRFAPDGTKIASTTGAVGEKPEIVLWRLPDLGLLAPGKEPVGRIANPSYENEITEVGRFEGAHSRPVICLAVSSDGRQLLSGSYDATVRLWDIASGSEIRPFLGHTQNVESVAFSPDGRQALSGSNDGTMRLWDIETGQPLKQFDHGGWVRAVAFSPDGGLAVSGSADYQDKANRAVRLWDIETGKQIRQFEGITHAVESLQFSSDGRQVLVAGEYHLVGLWDVETGKMLKQFRSPATHAVSAALSPDGMKILSGHPAQRLENGLFVDPEHSVASLWDVETGREIRRFRGHTATVHGVCFSPDGRLLLTCSGGAHKDDSYFPANDNSIRVWDIDTGEELGRIDVGRAVNSVAFTPDGRSIISGGGERRVGGGDDKPDLRLWRLPESVWGKGENELTEVRRLKGHTKRPMDLLFLADGKHALSCSGDETIRQWNVETGEAVRQFVDDNMHVPSCLALSVDEKILLSGHGDGDMVRIWDFETGRVLHRIDAHQSSVFDVGFIPDTNQIVTAAYDNYVRYWDSTTGEKVGEVGPLDGAACFTVAPDGSVLHGRHDRLQFFTATERTNKRELLGHQGGVSYIAISPSGKLAASASQLGPIYLWNLETGEQLARLDGHTGKVTTVTFTPDNRHLLSGGWDRTLRVWDVETHQEVARATTKHRVSLELAVSPDGRSVLAGGGEWWDNDNKRWVAEGDYDLRLWRLPESVVQADSITTSLGMKFSLIPTGEFVMGTAAEDVEAIKATENWFFADFVPGRREAETPQHRVTISKPVYMSAHEVTVGQFRQFVDATGYKTTAEQEREGCYGWRNGEWQEDAAFDWRNSGFEQTDDHPICNVSWDDAVEFCRWLSEQESATYRLPTEAEWEYGCRAGTTTLFSTGDDPNSLRGVANLADATLRREQPGIAWAVDWEDGFAATAPVGSFTPNAFGLYDMHGNVWEWCQDVYDDAWYETSPVTDPHRPGSRGTHIFRGGGFDNWPGFLRSSDRYSSHSDLLRTEWAGFRVVREVIADKQQPTN